MSKPKPDIVVRLREATVSRLEMGWPAPHVVQRKEPLWLDAAEEIERLRAKLAKAKRQRNKARRLYRALLGGIKDAADPREKEGGGA